MNKINPVTVLRIFCCLAFMLVGRLSAESAAVSPDTVLEKLIEGNKRFVGGAMTHSGQDSTRRLDQAGGQNPVAIVLTCADSRVGPEIVFDQGIGDLFVIRNAGNVLDDHVIGSMEYAVEHLHVPLIVVMGHSKCGAVAAACAGGKLPGHLPSIIESIQPAVESVQGKAGDKVDNAVRANASRVAGILSQVGPIIGEQVESKKVKVVAGRYDITTGAFELIK